MAILCAVGFSCAVLAILSAIGLKCIGTLLRKQYSLSFSVLPTLTIRVYSIPLDMEYRKNSKNWDTLNYYRDCPTNVILGFYSAILRSKDADRITNRVDTDQTAP